MTNLRAYELTIKLRVCCTNGTLANLPETVEGCAAYFKDKLGLSIDLGEWASEDGYTLVVK